MSADNIALSFQAPWILLPPGSRFFLPNGVHCSPDLGSGEELPFPQSQQPSGALAGLGLAPAGTSNPFPPYRKLSPAPDTFLLLSRASDLHWTSCPAWALVLYLSFPSVLEVFSSPSQGIPDEPPNVMPNVRIPEWEERRLPRQCNSQKKGNLLLTRVRAPAARPTQWYGVREHWAQAVTQFIRCA